MKIFVRAVALFVLVAAPAAAQTPVVSDTFTGADGTLLNVHQPDVDTPNHAWTTSGTVAILRSQQVQPPASDSNGQFSTAMIDTGLSDGTVAVDWTAASTTSVGFPIGALIVRGQDSANYVAVGYGIWGGGSVVVANYVNGSWSLVAQANATATPGQTHHLEARLAGSSIEVWWDGARLIATSDSTFQSATKQGFRWWMSYDWLSAFDNFSVTPPVPPVDHLVLTPSGAQSIAAGGTLNVSAQAFSASNQLIPSATFTWTKSNANVSLSATSGSSTTVTGVTAGSSVVTATTPNNVSATLALTITAGGGGTTPSSWNILGNNIYAANTGNVGIGTATPAAKLQVEGDVVINGNIAARYQDVAEWVRAAHPLDAGTVVVASDVNVVDASRRPYDTTVVGVVSPQPGLVLGEPGAGKVLVSQSGRVRVKVDASYGAVRVGDLLVTSPKAGVAMRSKPLNVGGATFHRPGTLLGKALEPLPGGDGEILVLLTLQ